MVTKEIINEICLKNPITTYLETKGILPAYSNGIMAKYRCPVHADDHTPSFVVYLEEPQNYFCYGCKSSWSIINLYCALEKKGYREALEHLGQGIDFSIEAYIDSLIDAISKETETKSVDPESIVLSLNRQIYSYMKDSKDPERLEVSASFLKYLDQVVDSEDLPALREMYESVPSLISTRIKNARRNKTAMGKSPEKV